MPVREGELVEIVEVRRLQYAALLRVTAFSTIPQGTMLELHRLAAQMVHLLAKERVSLIEIGTEDKLRRGRASDLLGMEYRDGEEDSVREGEVERGTPAGGPEDPEQQERVEEEVDD